MHKKIYVYCTFLETCVNILAIYRNGGNVNGNHIVSKIPFCLWNRIVQYTQDRGIGFFYHNHLETNKKYLLLLITSIHAGIMLFFALILNYKLFCFKVDILQTKYSYVEFI